ncbi:MAG: hypothetical protein IT328_14015 [Caldilineaceae bacterium]|nr:hypothetical protein [Caldilineaceae bacterium]
MSDASKDVQVFSNHLSSNDGVREPKLSNSESIPEFAPLAPAPDDDEDSSEEKKEWFRLLRRLRAEVQDLRAIIDLVQVGTTTLASQAGYLAKTKNDLVEVQQKLAAEPSTDDTVHHLQNVLEQVDSNPLLSPSAEPLPAQEQTNAVVLLLANIQRIELLVGMLTIPSRLNAWLKNSKPGYYVPFHLVFKDEIPNDDDRRTVLNHLAWSPQVIKNGIVDVTNGLVFRYSEDRAAQTRSLGWLAVAILASLIIVIVAARLPLPMWTTMAWQTRAATFVIGWLAVLIGVVTHIGVEGAKREKLTGLPTLLAVSDLRETIDARLGQMIWKLVLVLIGFFVVAFAVDQTVSVINAFLVGYSLDSVVGVFGASVETKVKAVEDHLSVK